MRVVARVVTVTLVAACVLLRGPEARADHGPATSGGGTVVRGAALPTPGTVIATLRTDATFFEHLSDARIGRMTARVQGDHAHVDALDWALLTSVEVALVALPRLQLAVSTGWYRGEDLREGHTHGGDLALYELHRFGDVVGATDLWVQATVVPWRAGADSAAVTAGVKLPTGRDDVRSDTTGETLEPALQAGSGAFDFALGGAYTHVLTPWLALDASAQLIVRTESERDGASYRIGHRVEGGIAATWSLTRDPHAVAHLALGLELLGRHVFENVEAGRAVSNTGGTVLFASPFVRVQAGRHLAVTVAPQLPVLQDLHGEQQATALRLMVAATATW